MHRNSDKKLTRSRKLRKYASVYKSHVRKTEQSTNTKSPRRQRNTKKDKTKKKEKSPTNEKKKPQKKEKKKPLNSWQKFVQIESKKSKYNSMPGKERLSVMATEWKNKKNKY